MTTRIRGKRAPVFKEDGPVVEPIPPVEEAREIEAGLAPLPWLTLEAVLYTLLIGLTLALRLGYLGWYPLSAAEAAQSWPALQLYRGELPTAESYSPLLLSLNALAFWLFGVSDATARLAPALLGMLLTLLPLTLRRQLGVRVSLLAAVLLALSPTALFLSRTLNSEVALAAGALLVIAGFFNWAEDGQQRWLLLLAAGLALLFTAGPMLVSILIVFGLVILVKFSTFKTLWQQGLTRSTPMPSTAPEPQTDSPPPIVTPEIDSDDGQTSSQLAPSTPPSSTLHLPSSIFYLPSFRRAGLFFLACLALLATAGLFNIGGLGMVSSFLPDWLSRFGLQGRPDAGFNAVFLLTIYEPLLVLAGLAGLAYSLLDKDVLKQTLAAWFIGLVVLDVTMIGRSNGSVILPLVPLAFLAALALAELWQGLEQEGSWGNEGLLLAAGLVIAVFSYIGLTGWLVRTCTPEDTICQYAWLQPIAALGLFLIIAIFFGFMTQPGVAGRGAALVGVALGLFVAISIGWRLNFGPLMDLAYQPLAGIPASTGLLDLTETLTRQSAERTGGQITAIDTTLAGVSEPALLWRLRDLENLTLVNSAAEAQPTMAIITPAGVELGIGQPYLGQEFTVNAVWSPVGLTPQQLLNWLIYRHIPNLRPDGSRVILWLSPEQG
ncbi:MAG: glycosyltransferase family 39 protein [Anaerolineae bacterium]|nr:glycosyltransferase family 39 protein [Anaerolineae bacterium]